MTPMHNKHFNDLDKLSNHLKKLDFNVSLIKKSDEIALNTLVCELIEDNKGLKRYVSFAFTPFAEDEIQYSKYLQIYSDINTEVTEDNYKDISEFLNTINCNCVIGHFVINKNIIASRYTYTLKDSDELDSNSIIETISLYLFSLDMYSELIEALAIGEITLAEAINKANMNKD